MTEQDKPRCDNCRFWEPTNYVPQCRKYAPRGFNWHDQSGRIVGSAFPVVNPDDWCGEHQPKGPTT